VFPELLRRRVRLQRALGRRGITALSLVVGAALLVVPGAVGVPGDPTPPVVTPRLFGTLGSNGWYTSNVTLNWTYTDPESIITSTNGCETVTFTADTPGISRTCTAVSDGGTAAITKTIKLDKSAPTVGGTPSRGPDANGWYNHPVGVSFSGADATSGLASCSSAGYGGPDNPAAVVGGTCVDNAGNVATAAVSLKYDATPPTLLAVTTKTGNRNADISWRMSSDTTVVEVFRAPGLNGQGETAVYRGTETGFRDTALVPARKYEYRIAAVDQAANRSESKVQITATGALFSPLPGAAVDAPPTLTWARVKGAAYYNVLLMRGRKIFSAWPTRTSFRLPRTWIYKGHRYKLRPGSYRWYIWPGFGRIAAAKYGRLLGGSTFVYRP
jgi:hypothetical protein